MNFSIGFYASISTGEKALIIGGYVNGSTRVATVACYSKSGWSQLDDLQSIRGNHRAIVNGDKIYVIGGATITG